MALERRRLEEFARDIPQFVSLGGGRYERLTVTQSDLAWFWAMVAQAVVCQELARISRAEFPGSEPFEGEI